ncbi:MAG: hypothetical protein COB36_06370 [Alphaproteobacteria bacterium]|nr:MAG: hypothetical protein COB36_06370 [Alphaproteobacteria bacterium]
MLNRIFKRIAAGASLNAFSENVITQNGDMRFESTKSEDGRLTAKQFMDGVKAVSESEDTYKVFDVYAADEDRVKNPSNSVVNEFGVFLREIGDLVPEDAVIEYAEHIVTNSSMKILAEKYPNEIMKQLYTMAKYRCPDGQGMQLLATLENAENENFFPYITARGEGTHVASFFSSVRNGVDDDAAIARLRVSPSFQAAQGNRVFLDYLMEIDPVLSKAIDSNYNHTAEQNL